MYCDGLFCSVFVRISSTTSCRPLRPTLRLRAVRPTIGLAVRDLRIAVERVQMREPELLVVHAARIEELLERVVADRTTRRVFVAAMLVPHLVERVELRPGGHELLVRREQRIAEVGHVQAGHLLELDVRSAAAIARGEHEARSGGLAKRADVRHRVGAEVHVRHAVRIGEAFREDHDDRVVREILRTLRVDLVGGLCIPIFDLLHGSLRILGLVLHRLDARETEERGERAIGLRILLPHSTAWANSRSSTTSCVGEPVGSTARRRTR